MRLGSGNLALICLALFVGAGLPVRAAEPPQITSEEQIAMNDAFTFMKGPDVPTRVKGLRLLAGFGTKAADLVPDVQELLGDDDHNIRAAAAETLARIGAGNARVLPAITKLLADRQWQVRRAAAMALAETGPAAAKSLPALWKASEDTNGDVHRAVLIAVWRVGGDAKPLVRYYVRLLKARGAASSSGYHLTCALGNMGPAATDAVPHLLPLLQCPDLWHRLNAVRVLGQIGPGAAKAVPALLVLLRDPKLGPRHYAGISVALGNIGKAAEPGLPDLIRLVGGRDTAAALAAVEALGKIAITRDDVIAALESALKSDSPRMAAAGCTALGRLGAGARSALPAIGKLKEHRDAKVRAAAAEAVKTIETAVARDGKKKP